jgi:ABC-type glycerol-3-phosphate transport system substrate-binding protein
MGVASAGAAGLFGALAACAPGGAGSSEAPAVSAQPATVRWPEGTTPLEVEFADEFNKRFNAKYGPKITAVMEPFPDPDWGKRYEKWTAMAVAGTMPEITFLCCTFIRPFMIKGLVSELDKFIKRDWKQAELDDFYKGPLEGMKVDGKQMGIPAYVNMVISFVNKNHLRQAGLAYPDENWDKNKFLEYAIKLHKRGEPWGFDMGFASLDRNIPWIWSNGGEPHDPKDGPLVTKLTYDDPKTIEALQFLHDVIWKHQVSPVRDDQRGGQGREPAFINGRSAIYLEATGNAAAISTRAAETGLDWDFLPLVRGPKGHGSRMSMDGYMVNKQTPAQDQSWTVVRELASTETQVLRAERRRLQPPRKSAMAAWEKIYEGKNAKLGRIMADTGRPDARSFWKDADIVGPIVQKYMDATMLRNEMPVAQAMKAAMEEVRGYFAANK